MKGYDQRMKAVLIGVVLLVLSGCSSGGEADSGDASARLACRHFRGVSADYADGLLTIDELREKFIEVHDDAKWSPIVGISENSRVMVAELTAERVGDALVDAIAGMGAACIIIGY